MKTETAEKLAVPVAQTDHHQGSVYAPAKLVEYGDYECPACGAAYPLIEAVQQALGDKLCFVYRHFPLTNAHPHAQKAAEAAEAAGAQGAFWEMHQMLFENQDELELEDLERYGAVLNLDVEQMLSELAEEKYDPKIRNDVRGGIRSGVNGTPTFFVNGVRYEGPRDLDAMVEILMRDVPEWE